MFICANFGGHWDLLLRECVKRKEKGTQIHHSQNFQENAFCPTKKHQLRHDIS